MGDWSVPGSSLTVPPFAGPDEPAWVVGDDIPANLVAYYAGFGAQTVVMAQIFRLNSVEYDFIALVLQAGITAITQGSANSTGISEITSMYRNGSQPTLILGSGGSNAVVAIETGAGFSIRTGAVYNIDGKTAPRGILLRVNAIANSATVAQTETVIYTTANADFPVGYVWQLFWDGHLFSSQVNQATIRVRRNSLAGVILAEWTCSVPLANAIDYRSAFGYIRNTGAAPINTKVVLTLVADVGTVLIAATPTVGARFEVRTIGAPADYTNAPQL